MVSKWVSAYFLTYMVLQTLQQFCCTLNNYP
jgi:hypothetical protein